VVAARRASVSAVAEKNVLNNELINQVRECLVDAENEAEIGECLNEPTAAVVREPRVRVDECIVDAESAAEIAACHDTTLGTSYHECVVDAESAAEIEACGAPIESTVELQHDDECVVQAENAAELLACSDVYLGTTYEECVVQAENAAEVADCGAAEPLTVWLDEECATEAENEAELRACSDSYLGTTWEECVVQAENAAEIADCRPLVTPIANGLPQLPTDDDDDECLVDAENADEITACGESAAAAWKAAYDALDA